MQSGDGGARLRVTLSAPGAGDATSEATEAVPTPPRNLTPPSIAGRLVVGARLTAAVGTWSGGEPLAFLYRWERCRGSACREVTAVARTRSYRVKSADRGRRLRFTVIAGNAVGRARASSAPTRRVR